MSVKGPAKKQLDLKSTSDESLIDDEFAWLESSDEEDGYDSSDDTEWLPWSNEKRFQGEQLHLLRAARSPVTNQKAVLLGQRENNLSLNNAALGLASPSGVCPHTPLKASRTSRVFTPNKSTTLEKAWTIEVNDEINQPITLYHNKVEHKMLCLPPKMENVDLSKFDWLALERNGLEEAKITWHDIEAVRKRKQDRKRASKSERQPSQQDAMNASAVDLAQSAGIQVKSNDLHWCHLYPHYVINELDDSQRDLAQHPKNLVMGTRHANAAMTLFEAVIFHILQKYKKQNLYLIVTVDFAKGFENIRLAEKVRWCLKDGKGSDYHRKMTVEFDMLSQARRSKSEVQIIKSLMMALFDPKSKGQHSTNIIQQHEAEQKENIPKSPYKIVTPRKSLNLFNCRKRRALNRPPTAFAEKYKKIRRRLDC